MVRANGRIWTWHINGKAESIISQRCLHSSVQQNSTIFVKFDIILTFFAHLLKDSDSIVSKEDMASYSIHSDKHSEHMTIDDPASNQYTNNIDSDTSHQITRNRPAMKRQASLESYPSSAYSGSSSDISSADRPIHKPHRKRTHYADKFESDQAILARREKQIDYGKNTTSYIDYITQVPK